MGQGWVARDGPRRSRRPASQRRPASGPALCLRRGCSRSRRPRPPSRRRPRGCQTRGERPRTWPRVRGAAGATDAPRALGSDSSWPGGPATGDGPPARPRATKKAGRARHRRQLACLGGGGARGRVQERFRAHQVVPPEGAPPACLCGCGRHLGPPGGMLQRRGGLHQALKAAWAQTNQ